MDLFKHIAVAALVAASLFSEAAFAADTDTVKVGLIAEFTGPIRPGKQIYNGMKAYMKLNGETVAGRKIEVIVRDVKGADPEVAKRLAQELVTRDQVDFLAGFGLTPNALAVAPIATQAKKPMIIMNAATSIITTKSPYAVRFSMTLPQVTWPIAMWSVKQGIKSVATIVSDYGPGLDAEATFTGSFTHRGGKVVEAVRTPLQNPDFTPFIQRAKDARPEAVFLFVPAGDQTIAFMKAFLERGLPEAGIKLIGPGNITDDDVLPAIGDVALGIVTSHHYSAAHDSPENAAFKKAYVEANGPGLRPNFMAVGGFDGMAAIYEVARRLPGKIDGDQAMAILKAYKAMSPRGPIEIDPATRDIIQNVYIRRVERVNGALYNVEFDRYQHFKDPGR